MTGRPTQSTPAIQNIPMNAPSRPLNIAKVENDDFVRRSGRWVSHTPNIQTLRIQPPGRTRRGRQSVQMRSVLHIEGHQGQEGLWDPLVEARIVPPTPLIEFVEKKLWWPPEAPKLLAPPQLIIDETTKELKYRTRTYEQQGIDEAEEQMAGPRAQWFQGIDMGFGGDFTTVSFWKNNWGGGWKMYEEPGAFKIDDETWGKLCAAMQIPLKYMGPARAGAESIAEAEDANILAQLEVAAEG